MAKKTFLDFEQPIAELEGKIEELRYVQTESAVDISEEIDQLAKERALGVNSIVLLGNIAARHQLLESHQFQSTLLKSANDLPHQAALDAIWFDHKVGSLHIFL